MANEVYRLNDAKRTELSITRKPLAKKVNIKAVMLTASKTYKNIQDGVQSVVDLKFSSVKQFVEEHKAMLFENGRRMQINIFTDQGWRPGKPFKAGKIDWFSSSDHYGDNSDVETIVAIQILIFPF